MDISAPNIYVIVLGAIILGIFIYGVVTVISGIRGLVVLKSQNKELNNKSFIGFIIYLATLNKHLPGIDGTMNKIFWGISRIFFAIAIYLLRNAILNMIHK